MLWVNLLVLLSKDAPCGITCCLAYNKQSNTKRQHVTRGTNRFYVLYYVLLRLQQANLNRLLVGTYKLGLKGNTCLAVKLGLKGNKLAPKAKDTRSRKGITLHLFGFFLEHKQFKTSLLVLTLVCASKRRKKQETRFQEAVKKGQGGVAIPFGTQVLLGLQSLACCSAPVLCCLLRFFYQRIGLGAYQARNYQQGCLNLQTKF